MRILGISDFGHDTSAALVEDGSVRAAAEEERFTRMKHAPGCLFGGGQPRHATEWCLRAGGLDWRDLDCVAIGFERGLLNSYAAPLTFLAVGARSGYTVGDVLRGGKGNLSVARMLRGISEGLLRRETFIRWLRKRVRRVVVMDHHVSHASSGFRASGSPDSNVLVMDSAPRATSLFRTVDGDLEVLQEFPMSRSLGILYQRFSVMLGFGFHGAGKVMGLAPYGRVSPLFRDILEVRRRHYAVCYRVVRQLRRYALVEGALQEVHRDMARTVQRKLEEAALELAEALEAYTGERRLCLAGGVALNCKMNGALAAGGSRWLYVPSAPGDSGASLGAAFEAHHRLGGAALPRLERADFGPAYSEEGVKAVLDRSGLRHERCADIAGETAHLLAQGEVVGWFQGRMEFGPRALGHRSILASPAEAAMRDRVNRLKGRELWQPVAPSIPAERASEFFEPPLSSPFMSFALHVRAGREEAIPAAVHVDGTARVQTVERSTHPLFHALLEGLGREIGTPVALNTSFNESGAPIVCSPGEAVRAFRAMRLDRLAIGPYMVTAGKVA